MSEHPITLVIADDHPVFRAGLSAIVKQADGITLLGEASDGKELLSLIGRHQPEVVLTDIDMPGMNGIDVLRQVSALPQRPKMIFLTLFDDEEFFNTAMDLGVNGFLMKENAAADILTAVRTVASGRYYFAASVSDHMVRRSEKGRMMEKQVPGMAQLTQTERKVLALVAQGRTTKEIAEQLFVSIKTIESHRTNIARKLQLTGTQTLLKFALENKHLL